MDQIRTFIRGLSLRQRLTLGVVTLLVITVMVCFVRWNKTRGFKPLYAELSPEDSGAVVAKLRESGVEYRLRESDSAILVPSGSIAELRLQMATAGIPKSGRIGYELFDKTNLGTTDFAEQVNYHRAIEGELERSLRAMTEVEDARVHITFPKESVFAEDRQPAKASVMVKLKPRLHLSEANATAITQLISSAVDGLAAEGVSVMDMQGNLLVRPKKANDGTAASDDVLQYKAKLERETLSKINSVLDPLLGSAKYRSTVDVDCDLTSGEESAETFDPDHSVVSTSQKVEEGQVGRDGSAGVPGTATNLPRPTTVRPSSSGNGLARRSETMAFQTNRTVRRTRLPQGVVRRMSVSVIIDQDLRWEVTGKGAAAHPQRVITPPSPERMKSIQAVVAAAAGVNTNRGDLLTVETQPFEATLTAEPPANLLPHKPESTPKTTKWSPVLLGSIGGGILLLSTLAFLVFRKRQQRTAQLIEEQARIAANLDNAALPERTGEPGEAAAVRGEVNGDSIQLAPIQTTKTEILTRQVSEQVEKDPVALARIVRTWLSETKGQ